MSDKKPLFKVYQVVMYDGDYNDAEPEQISAVLLLGDSENPFDEIAYEISGGIVPQHTLRKLTKQEAGR